MAFIKCSGGGKLKETVLWTNPDATVGFSGQTITLDYGGVTHDIDNYDYISINWDVNKTTGNNIRIYFTPKDLKTSTESTTGNSNIVFCARYSTNTAYARQLFYKSNTTLKITTSYNLGKEGTTTNYAIPTKISGWK